MESKSMAPPGQVLLRALGMLALILVALRVPAQGPAVTSVEVAPVPCAGASARQIEVVAGGGQPPYAFSSDNGLTFQESPVFPDLTADTYQIRVRDAAGRLSEPLPLTIFIPEPLQLKTRLRPATCSAPAELTLLPLGGTAPYAFSVDGGRTFQESPQFKDLAPGTTLPVLVRDQRGCRSATITVTIAAPEPIDFRVESARPTCSPGNNGRIDILAPPERTSLAYSIDGGVTFQPLPVFTGLAEGTYTVAVRDEVNDCPAVTETIVLTALNPLAATINSPSHPEFNLPCTANARAELTAAVTGGQSPFHYAWSNGSRRATAGNLSAGKYSLTITDARGCSTTATQTLQQGARFRVVSPDCQRVYLGYESAKCLEASVLVEGEAGKSYQFKWSSGATAPTVRLCPETNRTYTVTVTDDLGCAVVEELALQVVDVRCGPGRVVVSKAGVDACVDAFEVPDRLATGWRLGAWGADPCLPAEPVSEQSAPAGPAAASAGDDGGEVQQSSPLPSEAPEPLPPADTSLEAGAPTRIAPIREVVTPLDQLPAFLQSSGSSRTLSDPGPPNDSPDDFPSLLYDSPPGVDESEPAAGNRPLPRSDDGLAGNFDPESRMLSVMIDCPQCEPYESLTLDILDGGNEMLLYTGPVTIVRGKGEVRVPLSDAVDEDGLWIKARSDAQSLSGFVPGPVGD